MPMLLCVRRQPAEPDRDRAIASRAADDEKPDGISVAGVKLRNVKS